MTEKDEDFVFVDRRRVPSSQNRNNIENYISEVERYGISDRAAASLFNAAQRDLKIITDGKDKDAVDKYKIRRSRTSYRLNKKAKMKKKVEVWAALVLMVKETRKLEKELFSSLMAQRWRRMLLSVRNT